MYAALDGLLTLRARTVAEARRFDAALTRDLIDSRELLQSVHRRANHVVRVRRSEALRENVADARALHDRADRATGDHTGTRSGRLHQHLARAMMARDLVRNR